MKVAVQLQEIESQLTPFNVYNHVKDQPFSFILDSRLNEESLGRYSFVGSQPFAIFKSKGKKIYLWQREEGERELEGNPFYVLQEYINSFELISEIPQDVPPFTGGAVGYFGYDLGEQIEDLPGESLDDLQLPDCYLAFYEKVYAYDHLLNKSYLFALGLSKDEKEARDMAVQNMKELYKEISNISYRKPEESYTNYNDNRRKAETKSNFSFEQYCQIVAKAKEYIAAGDIYQVNLSQRFETSLDISPLDLYIKLRTINPAPFASFLNFDEVAIASASPERFLSLTGKKVETRPIKGTRPRGSNSVEDEKMKNELLNSEKDRAELVMIVDLERNDLGRVCMPGTVKVPELIVLETYATVFHLVSTVEGILPPDKDIIDILLASFPGGSITGAPKIRSMEIIDELEGVKRNVYTGSIGYISFNGNVDLNIVIRTFVIKNNRVYFQVGGGIVADSVPEKEYQETLDKAKALVESLGL